MQDASILSEDENFELIEGEIVPMLANTHLHELIKVGARSRRRAGAHRSPLVRG
jgi:hypothetical protein